MLPIQTNRSKAGRETFRVMHVEDSDDFAFLVARALRRAGFGQEPLHCENGARAIARLSLEEEPVPDAILLDLHMPVRNGFEVLAWVRNQSVFDTIPVVMLTSSEDPLEIARAKNLGATKFLVKGGDLNQVVETLEQFLAGSAFDVAA